jgi:TolA-binding protein
MGWTRLGTFATLVAAFASAAPAAAAPSQSETVRGILLQADIARIVERRKADDREVQQIRSYEQRIAGFRREVAQWRETASQRQRLTQGERRARELVERSLSGEKRRRMDR